MEKLSTTKTFVSGMEDLIPAVNDSPYKRILAIGDVHAAFDKLKSLWDKLSIDDHTLVVFLGDYLYGMSDKNVDTLHWLIEHKKRKNIIFLRGNTDESFLKHLFDDQRKIFHGLNSRTTVDIKLAAVKEPYLPQEIFDFLNNLPLYHSMTIGGRKYFFCHAGIKVGTPFDKQTKRYLIDHPELKSFYRDYSGNAVIVVGHKSPKKISDKLPSLFAELGKPDFTKPVVVPHKNILMLDTKAKDEEDGKLSCVDILSGEVWMS